MPPPHIPSLATRSLVHGLIGSASLILVIAYAVNFSTRWTLMPHRFCIINDAFLVWGTAVSNAVIAFAYFAIPAALLAVVRAVPQVFFSPRLVYLFATFIVACGLTHVMIIVTLWWPAYYLQLGIDGVTAIASAGTFRELVRAKPALTAFVLRLGPDDGRGRAGGGGSGGGIH